MDLQQTLHWLNGAGFHFQWRAEPNHRHEPAILRPPPGQKIELGAVEVAIVLPDIHLGFGADVFRAGGAAHDRRLHAFLDALHALRDRVGADKFRVVQLGDWYDFYRALGPTVSAQVAEIEAQYGDICTAAARLPILHCIGNHDAALYSHPHATTARFGIAQPIGTPRVMCCHGHDNKTLQVIQRRNLGASIGLNFVNLLALVPILGPVVNLGQMLADDSFQEAWTRGNTGGDKPWPAAKGEPPLGWTAPWVDRTDGAQLIRSARGLEYLTQTPLQTLIVGHSHRPGISSAAITAERKIALVDVGSWTYGRAEIAIVTPDGIGLAAIPIT